MVIFMVVKLARSIAIFTEAVIHTMYTAKTGTWVKKHLMGAFFVQARAALFGEVWKRQSKQKMADVSTPQLFENATSNHGTPDVCRRNALKHCVTIIRGPL